MPSSADAVSVLLRPATAADAASVAEVYLASRRTFLTYAPLAHTEAEVREWIAAVVIPGGEVTVAVENGTVVGMMALARRESMGWIDSLYLLPQAVGRGIGTGLFELAREKLGAPIRLYTFQANAGARRFYERQGFRAVAFSDGRDNEEHGPDVLYELSARALSASIESAMETLTPRIVGIYLSPAATVPPISVVEVAAAAHRGLVGDRYHSGTGTFSDAEPKGAGRELTLIESEVLAALEAESGVALTASEARRNLVTAGVRLNELLGVKFRIGEVLAEGVRLCHPCTHLDRVTGKGLLNPLENKGGLRASLLSDGVIRVGDGIHLV